MCIPPKYRKYREKGERAGQEAPIVHPRSSGRCESSLLGAPGTGSGAGTATKGHSQSGLIRTGAGALDAGRALAGAPHNRALVGGGGGGGRLPEPLIPRQERACFLPYSPEPTERQIGEDKEMLPLTVHGLFLEMGRLSCRLGAASPARLCPLDRSPKEAPSPSGAAQPPPSTAPLHRGDKGSQCLPA